MQRHTKSVSGRFSRHSRRLTNRGNVRPPNARTEKSLLDSIEEIVALLGGANEALAGNDFPAALELIGKARKLDPDDADIKALEEHVRMTCNSSPIDTTPGHEQEIIRGTIRAYEDEVYELAAQGEYGEATDLLARALMLDPADNDLRACERLIHAAAKVERQFAEASMLAVHAVGGIEPDPSPGSESETAAEADHRCRKRATSDADSGTRSGPRRRTAQGIPLLHQPCHPRGGNGSAGRDGFWSNATGGDHAAPECRARPLQWRRVR